MVYIAFDKSGLLNSAGLLPRTKTRNGDCACIIIMPRETEAGEELLVIYSEFEEKNQVGWVEFGVGAIIQVLREKL
jgi:hypothetical protein